MSAKDKLPQLCSVKPQDRKPRIVSLPALLTKDKAKQLLEMWQVRIGTELTQVNAKALMSPQLFMPGLGNFDGGANWGAQCGNRLNFASTHKQATEVTAYITYEPNAQDMARDYATLISEVPTATNQKLF